MRHYEVVVEENQPTCGGKSPTKSKILEVDTDDPIAYVKSMENEEDIEIEDNSKDELTIRVQRSEYEYWIRYSFTED